MKYLTLELIHAHLRIDSNIEDSLLTMFAESAEETVLNFLNRSFEDLVEKYSAVPSPVVHATLLLVDSAYEHRNSLAATTMTVIPYGNIDVMLKPYIIL
mgnify:CR=1 FL=1